MPSSTSTRTDAPTRRSCAGASNRSLKDVSMMQSLTLEEKKVLDDVPDSYGVDFSGLVSKLKEK